MTAGNSNRLPLVQAGPPPSEWAQRVWTVAQWGALGGVGLLVYALLTWPDRTLVIFWNAIVPLLPAVFLIHPGIWRNVCPLATVGMGSRHARLGSAVNGAWRKWAGIVGAILLMILVPGRRVLFNTDGTALAALMVSVVVLAWVAGRLWPRKSGFCNGFCPVLPVEKLYGQHPLITVSNARCADCSACSAVGCLDLAPEKVFAQSLGPSRKRKSWTFTPFGAFAAAFPGFVLAYFLVQDVGLSGAAPVFGSVWGAALTSWVLVTGVVVVTGVPAARLGPLLAGAAAMLYYWFTVQGVVELIPSVEQRIAPIRAGVVVLVGSWTALADRRAKAAKSGGAFR